MYINRGIFVKPTFRRPQTGVYRSLNMGFSGQGTRTLEQLHQVVAMSGIELQVCRLRSLFRIDQRLQRP